MMDPMDSYTNNHFFILPDPKKKYLKHFLQKTLNKIIKINICTPFLKFGGNYFNENPQYSAYPDFSTCSFKI